MANTINFSNTTPAAPGGQTNVTFQVDASTTPNLSAYVPAQVNADWSAVSGTAQILNKPTLGTAAAQNTTAFDAAGAAATVQAASLQIANNLSDLNNAATARTNLGLGTAATQASTAFDAAGAASAAVSAIPNATSSTTGLLGSADWSTFNNKQNSLGYTPLNPANNLSDVTAATARTNLAVAGTTISNTFNSAQVFSQSVTCNLSLIAKMVSTNCRTVTTATDTATVNTDHTLILNGVTTETLPASPQNGHKFHLVNINASAATVSGNGHNIWVAGVSAASVSLPSNTSIVLQYDTTGTIWRQIGAPSYTYTPLAPANNLSDVATPATALSNLIGSWQTWTPTVTGAGAMTVSGSPTVNDAQYIRMGPLVYFKLYVVFTLAGTAATGVNVTLPPVALVGQTSAVAAVDGTNNSVLAGWVNSSNGQLLALIDGGGTWPIGSSRNLLMSGFYRCV